jgi:hypothetical protein
MPTMVVAKPLVASALGVLLLNEHIQAGGVEDAAVIIGVVLIVIATAALARGEAATIVADAGGADRATPVASPTS